MSSAISSLTFSIFKFLLLSSFFVYDSSILELSDSKFRLIPEFSGENAGVANSEGGIESRVSWSGDISRIAGSEVRIKINMAARDNLQPKLYAAYVNGQ